MFDIVLILSSLLVVNVSVTIVLVVTVLVNCHHCPSRHCS